MAWDPTRPVPWLRLVREWLIYVGIMAVVLVVVLRDDASPGTFAGLFVSGPVYVVFSAVLAKFGYQRKTLRELRSQRQPPSPPGSATAPQQRAKPAPTRRTSTGPSSRPRRPARPRR